MKLKLQKRLMEVAQEMVAQEKAKIIVPAMDESTGFWFGGGNMIEDNGALYVCGRYRNYGDSRTGLGLGERGCELAIFKSVDNGETFEKVVSMSKEELSVDDREVLSIEGTAMYKTEKGVELFISTEKTNLEVNDDIKEYIKPGTGIWSIDVIAANSVEELKAQEMDNILTGTDPRYFNIKDPFVYESAEGDLVLLYCSHPFSWSSSNTGYMVRKKGEATFTKPNDDFFSRGAIWDVAITRGTAVVDLPETGILEGEKAGLMFYDGGECLRELDQHKNAKKRPRGFSCEEIGGVAYYKDGQYNNLERLSVNEASFISPWGTGCSRYVDVLATDKGYYVTWQQSQENLSQPLVMNFVPKEKVEEMLNR